MFLAAALVASTRPSAWTGAHAAHGSLRVQSHAMMLLSDAAPLEDEELQALAGVWRASLDLDDGLHELSCQLTADGRVHTTDPALENHPGHGGGGRWRAKALARPGSHGARSETIEVSIRIADWTLLATGVRDGLRCGQLKGTVLEGQDDPCCVGSFAMALALPEVDDGASLAALEAKLKARLDARPAPPARFARGAFSGGWRMLIDFDGGTPVTYAVHLHEDGTFATREVPGLGGHWGVWGKGLAKGISEWAVLPEGTHLWMRVERDRSTSTLAGMGGLKGVHESFSLWTKPELDSLHAELAARAGGYAVGAARGRGSKAPHALVPHVTGSAFFGAALNEYYRAGRCSMMRDDGGGGESVGI